MCLWWRRLPTLWADHQQQSAPPTSAAATWTRAAPHSTWAKPQLPAAGANYSTQRYFNFIIRMLYRGWLLHFPRHTFILCKLDSVLSVILLKFYVCMQHSDLLCVTYAIRHLFFFIHNRRSGLLCRHDYPHPVRSCRTQWSHILDESYPTRTMSYILRPKRPLV